MLDGWPVSLAWLPQSLHSCSARTARSCSSFKYLQPALCVCAALDQCYRDLSRTMQRELRLAQMLPQSTVEEFERAGFDYIELSAERCVCQRCYCCRICVHSNVMLSVFIRQIHWSSAHLRRAVRALQEQSEHLTLCAATANGSRQCAACISLRRASAHYDGGEQTKIVSCCSRRARFLLCCTLPLNTLKESTGGDGAGQTNMTRRRKLRHIARVGWATALPLTRSTLSCGRRR